MITCENLKVRYRGNDRNALNGINVNFKTGTTTALVGHNGAGKSTLVKSIVGLVPVQGNIHYDFNKDDLYKNIHIQMQQSNFEKGMKVKDILQLYKDLNDVKESSDILLDGFSLKQFKNKKIETLSGGERQRLAILLATIGNPKVIIFDEITTGLDSVARRQVWDLLQMIKKEKELTIILTSHFLEEVEYLADHIVILTNGEIVTEGSADDIIDEVFKNTRTIEFMGSKDILHNLQYTFHEEKNKYMITYEIENEYSVYKNLVDCGAYNIEIKQRTFEDAFLAITGYSLTKDGDSQ